MRNVGNNTAKSGKVVSSVQVLQDSRCIGHVVKAKFYIRLQHQISAPGKFTLDLVRPKNDKRALGKEFIPSFIPGSQSSVLISSACSKFAIHNPPRALGRGLYTAAQTIMVHCQHVCKYAPAQQAEYYISMGQHCTCAVGQASILTIVTTFSLLDQNKVKVVSRQPIK